MLTDHITEDATQVYKLHVVELKARWFPVFFVFNPKQFILDNGEHIFVALCQQELVDVCILIKINHDQYDVELTKKSA